MGSARGKLSLKRRSVPLPQCKQIIHNSLHIGSKIFCDVGAAPCLCRLPSSVIQDLPLARAICPLEEWRLLRAFDRYGGYSPPEVECTSLYAQSTPLHSQ